MLNNVNLPLNPNKSAVMMFCRYNYYICTVFFHGIRFKVKDKTEGMS